MVFFNTDGQTHKLYKTNHPTTLYSYGQKKIIPHLFFPFCLDNFCNSHIRCIAIFSKCWIIFQPFNDQGAQIINNKLPCFKKPKVTATKNYYPIGTQLILHNFKWATFSLVLSFYRINRKRSKSRRMKKRRTRVSRIPNLWIAFYFGHFRPRVIYFCLFCTTLH